MQQFNCMFDRNRNQAYIDHNDFSKKKWTETILFYYHDVEVFSGCKIDTLWRFLI